MPHLKSLDPVGGFLSLVPQGEGANFQMGWYVEQLY